jgi:hypothetical protein
MKNPNPLKLHGNACIVDDMEKCERRIAEETATSNQLKKIIVVMSEYWTYMEG